VLRRSLVAGFALVALVRPASAQNGDGTGVSASVWIGFASLVVLIVTAIVLFGLESQRIKRDELRVGEVSPRIVEKLARSMRNRWLAIAAAGVVVAILGPNVSDDPDAMTVGYLIGVAAVIALAHAARFQRLVALACHPDSVISASSHHVVIDCEHQASGWMRATPGDLARVSGTRLPNATVR